MPSGTKYKTREDAQAYADEQDGAVMEMEDPNGGTYFVVVPKPFDQGKFYDDSRKARERDTNMQMYLQSTQGKNMGGVVVDELGYMRGGMKEEKRGPIKYADGGAISGKNFRGSF